MAHSQTCQHKALIGCILTALPGCCGCSDKRPVASAYPTYVDGQGMRLRGNRYDRYCWRCRDYWRTRQEEDSLSRYHFDPAQPWSFAPQHPVHVFGSEYQGRDQPRTGVWGAATGYQQQRNQIPEWTASANMGVPLPNSSTSMQQPQSSQSEQWDRTSQSQGQQQPIETQLQHYPRRQRMRENVNPFGTREEWESDQYQSPLTGMFTRAWNRYRDVENERRREQAEAEARLLHTAQVGVPAQQSADTTAPRVTMPLRQNPFVTGSQQLREVMEGAVSEMERRTMETVLGSHSEPSHSHPDTSLAIYSGRRRVRTHTADDPVTMPDPFSSQPPTINPIDLQTRPPALRPEDMTVNIACRICSEQKSDTLIIPCHHLSICRWCVQILQDEGRSRRSRSPAGRIGGQNWRCPMCRRVVESTKRIYLT